MKISALRLVPLLALLCAAGAQAAEMNKANVMRDYSDTVAPAEQQAYEAGVKAYNQCLAEHGFKYKWTAWSHATGNVYSYSYVSDAVTWGDFDAMHEQGKPCDSVWTEQVNPHLMGETSAFMIVHPEMSHMPEGVDAGTGLIGVTSFTLKNGRGPYETFMKDARLIAEAAAKAKWPGHYAFVEVRDAGPHAPDFLLVMPAKNWADYGRDIEPPLWKMVANVYGQKKADEIRKSVNGAIKKASSHADSYDADLTFTPSGH